MSILPIDEVNLILDTANMVKEILGWAAVFVFRCYDQSLFLEIKNV